MTAMQLTPAWATTAERSEDDAGTVFYKRATDVGIELTQTGVLVVATAGTAVYEFDEPIVWLPHVPDDILTIEEAQLMVAALQDLLTAFGGAQ